jgi:hypothetical protein
LSLYTGPVDYRAFYTGYPDFPWQSFTLLGADPTETAKHFIILSQRANGICYTLWGFRSHPELLTDAGKKLFSNLAWQPMCMPAVLNLSGDNSNLQIGLDGLLANAGFPYQNGDASNATGLDTTGFDTILVDWDTTSDWSLAGNAAAVRTSRLPVVAMGSGGARLLQAMGVPMALAYATPFDVQTEADLADPLQLAFRRPYPLAVLSPLRMGFDTTTGVNIYNIPQQYPQPSETVIGYWITSHTYQVFATQPLNGVCYQLYGFQSYVSSMTPQAMSLLRNMLAVPTCNHPAFLPVLRR